MLGYMKIAAAVMLTVALVIALRSRRREAPAYGLMLISMLLLRIEEIERVTPSLQAVLTMAAGAAGVFSVLLFVRAWCEAERDPGQVKP